MLELHDLIAANEDWLLNRVLQYAREYGYARYWGRLEDEWPVVNATWCSLVLTALATGDCREIHADHDVMADPLAAFGMNEARLSRERGIDFSRFFVLMKHCRKAFLDLLLQREVSSQGRQRFRDIIASYFDRLELGAYSRWTMAREDHLMRELRNANVRLTAERNKSLTIFESLPSPVLFISQDANFVEMCNRAAAELFGAEVQRAASSGGHDRTALPAAIAHELAQFAVNAKQITRFDAEVASSTGEKRFIVLMQKVIDSSAQFRGYVAIFNDVTALKEMESEIEVLHTDLAARAYELEHANRELEAFNYTVSHDLRAPLTGINGYCQLILAEPGERLDEQCREYIQGIYRTGERMNQLITTLLDFSRLGKCRMEWHRVDLAKLAAMIFAGFRMTDPHRRISLLVPDAAVVNGDPHLLRVVMDNLLGNAWKYTSCREDAVIEFGVMAINRGVGYFVRDNGTGFDMGQAAQIFTPFNRLHGSDEFEGSGVGLATVERIIRRHGGKIKAEGEAGVGAKFSFSLGNAPHV